MNNIIVLPMIVPIITAIFLVFLRDYIKLQRIISFITMIFVTGISVVLLAVIQTEGIIKLDFSGWVPPFGILFVADSFSVNACINGEYCNGIMFTLCICNDW